MEIILEAGRIGNIFIISTFQRSYYLEQDKFENIHNQWIRKELIKISSYDLMPLLEKDELVNIHNKNLKGAQQDIIM